MTRLHLLPVLLAACALLRATPALADDPAPSLAWMPTPTALQLRPLFGEPTGDTQGLAPALAVMPLRLSLLSTSFPIAGALGGAPCASREEASGNTVNGFAVQRQVYLAITPRLVLHGFSSAGCPLDAGIGGGLTYSVPVAKSVFLVASAGAYSLPSAQPGRVLTKGDARIDLIFRSTPDRAWGIGLGRRGVKLTGTW
jgi:hypothetical protein